ncbi:MAG: iron ABC transporter permease [Planctomycetes bacterium]|nr:iron ABC transporter permease [Planctomycetota bacterium]
MTARHWQAYVFLVAVLAAVSGMSVAVGTTGVPFSLTWYELGLPRLLMGMLAGASLSIAGAMFQSLFRNPLASPYTLGVSSGASLGAAVVIMLVGGGLWHGLPLVSLAAFAGAVVCMSVVYLVANLRRSGGIGTLLLAGITIGFICSALIVMVLFLAQRYDLEAILQWTMGSLQVVGFDPVYETLAMAAVGGGVVAWLHRDLDLLMMGEVVAAGRGVSVRRSRLVIYFAASLLTAGVVAHCGPIGFVGLMIPHLARHMVGPQHRYLLPACVLTGAAFLPLCDLLARNTMWWMTGDSRQVPVGVLTNLIGGAFFLYLLLRGRGGMGGM